MGWLIGVGAAGGQEAVIPVLKVGSDVYSNAIVTEVTATDIYFKYAGGMGNAKLKNLDPQVQKRFGFDAVKGHEYEDELLQANALFRAGIGVRKPAATSPGSADADRVKAGEDADEIVVPKLYAKSFRGQRPPELIVEQWLTPPPDTTGKFVLIEFWATWCGPCKQSIPHLNDLYSKFKDHLVVIGLSNEPLEAVQELTEPRIEYAVGTDTQSRTLRAAGVEGIPHLILIDRHGIVRFEGMPEYLTEQGLTRLLARYSN